MIPTPATSSAPTSSSASGHVKALIAPADYERLRSYLQHTIPGGCSGSVKFGAVDDHLVDAFVLTLWRDYKPGYAQLGGPPPPAELAPHGNPSHGLRYY